MIPMVSGWQATFNGKAVPIHVAANKVMSSRPMFVCQDEPGAPAYVAVTPQERCAVVYLVTTREFQVVSRNGVTEKIDDPIQERWVGGAMSLEKLFGDELTVADWSRLVSQVIVAGRNTLSGLAY